MLLLLVKNRKQLFSAERLYEAVLGRLHSEALIQRFTLKFLEDQSYLQLKQALENKNYEDAFRSAHTLKGVCQNLSFDRLYEVRIMKTHSELGAAIIKDMDFSQDYPLVHTAWEICRWHHEDGMERAIRMD